MTHKNLTTIVAIIALGLITSTAMAKKGGHKRSGHFRDNNARIYKDLDLTQTQQQQIVQIREKARNDSKPLHEKIRKLSDEKRAEWIKETPKKGNLIALNRQIHDIKQKLGEHRIETKFKTMAVLTKEQQAKMKSKMKNHSEDGKGRGFKEKHQGNRMGTRDKQFKKEKHQGNKMGTRDKQFKKGHRTENHAMDANRGYKREQAKQCVDTRLVQNTEKRPS